ncbi:MAG: flagellar biosynthesis protein FlhB [Devosiaceae bacterium]|nr:flagellar biosynthesis protein FlhB [Devosiaceae bacterium MH13]
MADDQPEQSEKTEDPSQRKLDEAYKRGDVPKSQELSSAFVLLGGTLVVAVMTAPAMLDLAELFRNLMEQSARIPVDGGGIIHLVGQLGPEIGLALALPFLFLMAMAVAGNLVQHRLVFSVDPLTPKLSKVSPLAGFKRLFSGESLMNFAKGLLKISLVGVLMVLTLYPRRDELDAVLFSDVRSFLLMVLDMAVALLLATAALMIVIGVADYLYQRHRWFERQKMTVKEVKDEYKQQEGDPTVKAKLRQLRMERSRRRMMAAVPDATVVVTNPTHFAVALRYEDGMGAPVCVAKGVDAIALSIRQVAREHEVAIVENPPLARALHASVELDQTIPSEHFQAVAKVIGFVMRLRERRRARS